jgi:hypothetical protein
VLVLFSLYYLISAIGFGLFKEFGPGPGLLPRILGLLMLVLGIIQLLSKDCFFETDKEKFLINGQWKQFLFLLTLNILTVCFMETIGFIPIMTIFSMLLLTIMDKWPVKISFLFSILISLICWFVFSIVFKLPLPLGLLSLVF